ncbi:hypothetical protein COO60DRAFT_1464065 [Scenedesmus sp. NREL 46B-D3]|nr:hypothetical protein COO60DRAFT_1464065 [Scenedesmus sp. NREL 46B-D3]
MAAEYSAAVLCTVYFPSLGIPCSSTLVELVVQDTHATVQQLCQSLSKHLQLLAGTNAVVVSVTELRWQGSSCDPANCLDLYCGLQPCTSAAKQATVVRFSAIAQASSASTLCVLSISDSTGSGANPFVLNVGSPYITVAELHRKLAAAAPPGMQLQDKVIYHQDIRMADGNKLLSDYHIQDTARLQRITIRPAGPAERSAEAQLSGQLGSAKRLLSGQPGSGKRPGKAQLTGQLMHR